MKNRLPLTIHTIVKNDENWIWFALMSVKDFTSEIFVHDDNSSDRTADIIKSINDPKIILTSGPLTPQGFTDKRNEMLEKTKTDWFLLLDGDEVWNQSVIGELVSLLSGLDKDFYGVVMRTRNCIGDIYHYLPESEGKYEILGKRGNLNIRAYRKIRGFKWFGAYPLEAYVDISGNPINHEDKHLAFFDGYYWHMTHLRRSSSKDKVKGWRNIKFSLGIPIAENKELPEVLFDHHSKTMIDVKKKRGLIYEFVSVLMAPLKIIKSIL